MTHPDPPHEYVHNEAYPDEVYCRNCGLYPVNGATRSCNEEERQKWRDIQDYLREGLQ